MVTTVHRKFNGYTYHRDVITRTKAEAMKEANQIRQQGDRARIVKTKEGYEIFFRSGRKG